LGAMNLLDPKFKLHEEKALTARKDYKIQTRKKALDTARSFC
jgi:hypothetical protein